MIKKVLLAIALIFGSISTVTIIPATPAVAEHQGACWEVWDFTHNEWWFNQHPSYSQYGWWRNQRYDVYRECENHQYGTYLGNYGGGWHKCWCEPWWYSTPYDVYY